MFITKKIALLTLSSVVSMSLIGCGSGSSGGTEEITEEITEGLAINLGNASSVIQSGVIDTSTLTADLLTVGDDIDTSVLILDSFTENSNTYLCNAEGTLTITADTVDTAHLFYDNCVQGDVHYHGDITVQTTVHSGAENVGSDFYSWSQTQNASLTNFERTEPVSNGVTNKINGNIVVESANDADTQFYTALLTSSDLSYDVIASNGSESSYDFSDLSYVSNENYADNIFQQGLDFTAVHSEFGNMHLVTEPLVSFESGLLESGTATFTTGASTAQLNALGGDEIEVSIDTDNDGDFDFTLPSPTGTELFGDS